MSKQKLKPKNKSFAEKVRDAVRTIPKGRVMTYGAVAKKAGNAKAARAVGTVMAKNFDPKIPCHRVVRSDGFVGPYNRGGPKKKAALLKNEGVVFLKSGKIA